MSAFEDACKVELSAMDDLLPWLDGQADSGRVVLTSKGRLSEFLQRTVGDAVIQRDGGAYGVEFKIEEKHTGNFFLETWSNLSRFKTGWLCTLDTDILLYYFSTPKALYSIPFKKLQRWAFGCVNESPNNCARVYAYPEKRQRKRDQRNDTWGRVVPIEVVHREVGLQIYHLNEIAQAAAK